MQKTAHALACSLNLSLRKYLLHFALSLGRRVGTDGSRMSVSQRSRAPTRRGEGPGFALYGRRNTARKKVSCVLSAANVIILFRTIEIFEKNLFASLETTKEQVKNWGLSRESSPHFVNPSLIEMVAPLTFSS